MQARRADLTRRIGRPRRRARCVRAPDRPRLPDARRRARRVRSGRAHRQVARHRPARRHGHPPLHPRARKRAGARCVRPRLARAGPRRPRRCASESQRPERWSRHASARSRSSPRRRRRCRRSSPTADRCCWNWSPTRSSSATAEDCRGGASDARAGRSEVARDDQVGVERAHEELDFLGHVRVRHAAQIPQQRAEPRSSSSSRCSTAGWSKTPSRRDSHSGQRRTIRQWRGPSSDQSSG